MCGRFALTATPDAVREAFEFTDRPNFPARDDIRPTEPIGVVLRRGGDRRFALARWGFLPGWVKDPADFPLLINARAETAAQKPSFRGAMRHGRCIVPATAFAEWRHEAGERRAERWTIAPRDGGLFGFAGLVETWEGGDGIAIDTAVILTVDANADVAFIHDRMPAILAPADVDAWLDTDRVSATAATALLRPAELGVVVATPWATEPARAEPAAAPPAPARRPARRRRDDDAQGSLF